MRFKRKFIILAILVILIIAANYLFPEYGAAVRIYDRFIFYPLQSLRIIVFGILPFSIGDIIYIAGGLWALVTILRWLYFLAKFGAHKERLAASLLRCINTILFVYLLFVLGWGANYYKMPLRKYWHLETDIKHKKDTTALAAFDKFLISKLNTYAPHYHTLSLKEVNERSQAYYRAYTDCKTKRGLGIKSSLFGNFMERFDIEGYYNPFTGEGQVNKCLPAFMYPFTVCHEMAHQSGIAAEGDANLMAYALGTTVNDSTFRYSCYLNIWLYTNERLYFHDSALAKSFESQLNKITRSHIDTLNEIDRKFHNDAAKYSGEVYDSYLRMQQQKEGIRSYGNVSSSAWQLELQRNNVQHIPINIP